MTAAGLTYPWMSDKTNSNVADLYASPYYKSDSSTRAPSSDIAELELTQFERTSRCKQMACALALYATGTLTGFGLMHPATQTALFRNAEKYQIEPPPTAVPSSYMASPLLNNSCLVPNLEFPPGPQTFDACEFVIRSTDEVWNLRGDVDASIEKYFHEGYLNAGSWGRRGIGKKELRTAVYSEMRAFPDIQIHITDCTCRGNDINGYKCSMPDVLTGTNLGPSAYGPATGRYARWTGMVESIVKMNPVTGNWQFYAEWGVHDEWALIQQLGLDFERVPHPLKNPEPVHDCNPLFSYHGVNGEPLVNGPDSKLWGSAGFLG